LVHCWYSLGSLVTIGIPTVLSVFDDWYNVPFVKNSQKTVKTAKITIVYQSSHVYQNCTNSVPIVKNSQKTVKQQKMTIGVPIVTCLHRVRRIHKAAQTPLPRETSITMCLGSGHIPSPVGRADSMCLHAIGRPCVWLPFAAACCYTLLMI